VKSFTPLQIRKYFETRMPGVKFKSSSRQVVKGCFHDDRNPSLSIDFDKCVFCCHIGCGEGGLVDFEHKLNGGTREEALIRVAAIMGATVEPSKSDPVAIYQYRDAHGNVLFEKLRYKPKRFTQRRLVAPRQAGAGWVKAGP